MIRREKESRLTLAALGLVVGDGLAEVAGQALVAVEAGRVVDALEALARRRVAVKDGVLVHVAVAHAPLAGTAAPGLAEPPVRAELALASW